MKPTLKETWVSPTFSYGTTVEEMRRKIFTMFEAIVAVFAMTATIGAGVIYWPLFIDSPIANSTTSNAWNPDSAGIPRPIR